MYILLYYQKQFDITKTSFYSIPNKLLWNINVFQKENTYLNIVCTATMVLQSANVSSSAEFDSSLFTTTTFSANNIPALKRSSKLKIILL